MAWGRRVTGRGVGVEARLVSRMLEDGRAVARGWASGGQRIGISRGIRVRGAAAGAVEARA
jgi:hypothetical protein